ncbi:MAG: large conductance mechanosensitive channel protein MscL [Candidatus Obscuribacterales bacterium]
MLKDFVSFLTKANALALAIGVIIGGATGKLVSAVVDDMLMPVVGLIMPAGDWREAQIVLSQSTDAAGKVTVNALKYGHLLGAVLDFVIISFVVYILTKALLPNEPPAPATKVCPECLETVPAAAHKCRACTAAI